MSATMRRREFITLIGGAAAWPVQARAQQAALPVVGFVNPGTPEAAARHLAAFRKGLAETGYVESQNVMVEYHWLEGKYDRLQAVIADLVRRPVAVIATPGSGPATRAAKAATATIPIVFGVAGDPVQLGLVASLSRPGGNATGITLVTGELTPKRLELLREVVPGVTTVALFMNPDNQNVEADIRAASDAARALRLSSVVVKAAGPAQFEAAFDEAQAKRAGAMLVASDPTFLAQRAKIIELAAKKAVPVMYWSREFTDSGGLISFGSGITWMYRAAGLYCAKILKGAPPGDLPILQPTTFQTYINLKTAKALGLTIPQTVLVRADEVIQ
jgi:putative ABC transport system substrate-binding protein